MAEAAVKKSGSNGLAIASLITGIIPGLGLLGIIFGFVALSQIKKTNEGGKGMAITGIVLGFIQFIFGVIWMVFFFWAVNTATDILQSPYYSNEVLNSLDDLNNIQLNF